MARAVPQDQTHPLWASLNEFVSSVPRAETTPYTVGVSKVGDPHTIGGVALHVRMRPRTRSKTPYSPALHECQEHLGECVDRWHALTDDQRAYYNANHPPEMCSGYIWYMSLCLLEQLPPDWISPTSHVDTANCWNDPPTGYDDYWYTYCTADCPPYGWCCFLELHTPPLPCSKIRYMLNRLYEAYTVDIDVHHSGGWQHLYEGDFPQIEWIDQDLGGTFTVTAVRFRFLNHWEYLSRGSINEVYFWQVQ